jgi:hypothetical protein
MTDKQNGIDADLIARASASWLETATAGRASKEWVHDLQIEWLTNGQFECLWRFILRLCETVDPEDSEIIDQIGVDPLVDLILSFPDQALEAIEDVAAQQPTVMRALSIFIGYSDAVDSRIDAILARHGVSGE